MNGTEITLFVIVLAALFFGILNFVLYKILKRKRKELEELKNEVAKTESEIARLDRELLENKLKSSYLSGQIDRNKELLEEMGVHVES